MTDAPTATAAEPTARRLSGLVHCLGIAAGFAGLLTIHLTLIGNLIARQTPTLDEVAHLPAGRSYVEQMTFRMYRHSPPLARLVGAWLAGNRDMQLRYDGTWVIDQPANHWKFAFETVDEASRSPDAMHGYLHAFTLARWGTAFWSALAIPALYLWGSRWFGPAAGWLAAGLWTISPNVLAHGSLLTTDVAATSAALWTAYLFSRWLDAPTTLRWLVAGVALGVAQLVKFSSLWLYPLLLFWLVGHLLVQRTSIVRPLISWLLMALFSVLAINVGYLFEGTGTPMGDFPFLSQSLTRPRHAGDPPLPATNNITYTSVWADRCNRFVGTPLERLPCPLPYHFVAGFDEQKFEAEGKYPMYLRGRFADPIPAPAQQGAAPSPSRRGWWYYYLYALGVKVPPGTWILFTLGLLLALFAPRGRSIAPIVLFAVAPVAAMSLLTDINLGVRYVLPALPFVFLVCGSVVARGRPRRWLLVAGVIVAANVAELVAIHPHELSYFNHLVGGPTQGRFHLIDSNIDWGQDLRGLARWLAANPDWKEEIKLAYAGTVPPEFEGIKPYQLAPRDLRYVPDYRLLPWERRDDPATWGPMPGKYAVSVNLERGMRFHAPAPRAQAGSLGSAVLGGSSMIEIPRGSYAYFQQLEPRIIPEIGYSILLYDVSREDANRVRAQLGLPLLE